jgi:hypothetical protein
MMLNNKELNLRFKIAILVNTIFTLIEFAIGVMSGSLALISDACQNLSDVTSLIISFIAQKIALKNANVNKTFGYGRITVLSALVNVLLLLVIAIYILSEVYKKFCESKQWYSGMFHAEEIETSLILYLRPELVKMEKAKASYPERPRDFGLRYIPWEEFNKVGIIGDPTKSSADKGKMIFEFFLKQIVDLINNS